MLMTRANLLSLSFVFNGAFMVMKVKRRIKTGAKMYTVRPLLSGHLKQPFFCRKKPGRQSVQRGLEGSYPSVH